MVHSCCNVVSEVVVVVFQELEEAMEMDRKMVNTVEGSNGEDG